MQEFEQYLRRVYKDLDEIISFRDVDRSTPTLEEEYSYLQGIASQFHEKVAMLDEQRLSLAEQIEIAIQTVDSETGDDKSSAVGHYNKLLEKMDGHLRNMNHYLDLLDMPYFGKIIFDRRTSENMPEKLITTYIGKHAYFDQVTQTPLITDWRAPIANLYYHNTGPAADVDFTSPAGKQEGDLKQKRQFEIEKSRISSIYDAKSGNAAADQFLLSQLKQRIGQKLTDIVATIQEQQNTIIREGINYPVMIQGVAGSGKTTIILHRLAYMFYTYSADVRPEKSLIIAPNTLFLDYISDVLPSLGVYNMGQNTYLFWARAILQFDNRYIMSTQPDDLEVLKFKGSEQFKDITKEYFNYFLRQLFDNMPGGSVAITIEERFDDLRSDEVSMDERLKLAVDYAFAQKQFAKRQTGGLMSSFDADVDRKKKILDYIKKEISVFSIYKGMYNSGFKPSGVEKAMWDRVRKVSLNQLKPTKAGTHSYKVDDLPPLLLIHMNLFGERDHMREYIVVDEAQDLSIFQLLSLFRVAKNGNMTIAGDLAQSIMPPFHISDWDDVMGSIKREFPASAEFVYHQLHRCYRSTVEIIQYANSIFAHYFPGSYKLPEAVLRHGDPVSILHSNDAITTGNSADIEMIIKHLNSELANGSSTVALICKDAKHAEQVYAQIKPHVDKLDAAIVDPDDQDYHTGILIIPVSRAKGLEFDSVTLIDVDKELYSEEMGDIRLLYVAITRALHRLFVVHRKDSRATSLSHTS